MTPQEFQYFNELLKTTLKQIAKANKEFTEQRLMSKIKENGSLYAVPSSNNTADAELEEAMASADPIISKPVGLMREGDILELYEQFRDEIEKIRAEEYRQQEKKQAAKAESNIKKHKEKAANDSEDFESEFIDTVSAYSPSQKADAVKRPVKISKYDTKGLMQRGHNISSPIKSIATTVHSGSVRKTEKQDLSATTLTAEEKQVLA